MEHRSTLNQLQEIFQSFFKDNTIILTPETSAHDIEGWDSMNHMNLMSNIEKAFHVQFDFFELMDFENVGDLIKALNK